MKQANPTISDLRQKYPHITDEDFAAIAAVAQSLTDTIVSLASPVAAQPAPDRIINALASEAYSYACALDAAVRDADSDYLERISRREIDKFKTRAREILVAPVAAQPPKLTPNELEALHDFQRTVIMDSCHTLGKPMIKRLTGVGALESMGFGKHRLTEYGKWLLERHTTSVIDTASVAPGPS